MSRATCIKVGQCWRDEDGVLWNVVAVSLDNDRWVYVRPKANPKSPSIMTNRAWFKVWALIG